MLQQPGPGPGPGQRKMEMPRTIFFSGFYLTKIAFPAPARLSCLSVHPHTLRRILRFPLRRLFCFVIFTLLLHCTIKLGLDMASGFDESMAGPSSTSSSNGETNDAGDFECNICFELAQDPIVTLCGHLFCWPCLYRWLHYHSQSQECPACKSVVQEEKLVPLYGRGKSTTDPRSRPIPGDEIPNRPSGQRPETAPPPPRPDQNYFSNLGFGFLGGFMPMATARIGNMTMSAGVGGLFPSLMSFQFNGIPDGTMYGAAHGFPYGYPETVNRAHGRGVHHGHGQWYHHPHHIASQGQDSLLKNLLLFIIFLVLLTFIWS